MKGVHRHMWIASNSAKAPDKGIPSDTIMILGGGDHCSLRFEFYYHVLFLSLGFPLGLGLCTHPFYVNCKNTLYGLVLVLLFSSMEWNGIVLPFCFDCIWRVQCFSGRRWHRKPLGASVLAAQRAYDGGGISLHLWMASPWSSFNAMQSMSDICGDPLSLFRDLVRVLLNAIYFPYCHCRLWRTSQCSRLMQRSWSKFRQTRYAGAMTVCHHIEA